MTTKHSPIDYGIEARDAGVTVEPAPTWWQAVGLGFLILPLTLLPASWLRRVDGVEEIKEGGRE